MSTDTPNYVPEAIDVARFIVARTRTQGGDEAGTFNPASYLTDGTGRGTRPTAEQVADDIQSAMDDVSDIVGATVPTANAPAAKRVVALRAALLIELNRFPEQVAAGNSPYPQLKDLYDEMWENLLTTMGISVDQGGGATSIDAGFPSYGGFPTTAIGMDYPW